jgi:transcriptional regulator with XRE-family HTH domain
MKFGHLIRKERINKGLTQQQLADMVDCGVAHITRIETGAVYPSVKLLEQIFNKLNIAAYQGLPLFKNKNKSKIMIEILFEFKKLNTEDMELILKILRIISEKASPSKKT